MVYTWGDEAFDWHDHNTAHVRQNRVEPEEAEDAVLDPDAVGMPAYDVGRERRWALVGRVEESGRVLFVAYTHRRRRVRVITARDAPPREKRRYITRGK